MVKNFLIVLKNLTADAIKIASKRAIQKTAGATGDLIGNKIADKTTSVSKNYPKELHSQNEGEIVIPKERYIFPEKRQQIIDALRLVYWDNNGIKTIINLLDVKSNCLSLEQKIGLK